MFWSSPSADLEIIIFLLVLSLGVAIASYWFSKKILLAVFVMSLLGNLSIYLNSGSRIFDVYHVKYIVSFTLHIWPYINIALLLLLFVGIIKNKYTNTTKTM